jgi:uncharacterized protein YndB with AHSA1/START domain
MKARVLFFTVVAVILLISAEIFATVTDSSFYGFTIKHELVIHTSSDSLFTTFTDIGRWWDSDHTYSGKAANMSLEPFAGGCFCEILGNGGGVHHMTVLYVDPGKIIRLEGGLGPLQSMAVNGIMTVTFTKIQEGTKLAITYTVGGYTPGGLSKIALAVDNVLGLQVSRLKELAQQKKK